jgi:hypothetical protein
MPFPLDITSAGGAGEHVVRRVTVNAQDDYIYFKENTNFTSTIPNALTQGTGFIFGEGAGQIDGVADGDLVFIDRPSPTQLQLTSDAGGVNDIDLTGSAAGQVSFNTPVVFDSRLNIDASTPTNQAVKYYTNDEPLTGLTSGETYFLKNVSVSDFAGQQTLYNIDDLADPVGQAEFTTPGSFLWTAPLNVTEVSVVTVGAGGGGAQGTFAASGAGGGGLGWRNRIPVSPGRTYTVTVGAGGTAGTNGGTGGDSWFISTNVVRGGGGLGGVAGGTTDRAGGTFVGEGGGNGGIGGARRSTDSSGGGGGAGGYTGAGGRGGGISGDSLGGSGGAAGGGGWSGLSDTSGSGGGVGLLGSGANGAAGINSNNDGKGGGGGSGGGNGAFFGSNVADVFSVNVKSTPGNFGGGAGGSDNTGSEIAPGGGGAVRIIWGPNRAFPATGTGNL